MSNKQMDFDFVGELLDAVRAGEVVGKSDRGEQALLDFTDSGQGLVQWRRSPLPHANTVPASARLLVQHTDGDFIVLKRPLVGSVYLEANLWQDSHGDIVPGACVLRWARLA